jgi:autotransporter-associated beta strand protein
VDSTMDGSITSVSGAPIALTKVGLGKLTLGGVNTVYGPTVISSGTLALSGSGRIRYTPTFELTAGAFLDSSARTDGALVLDSGQTLFGEGTVLGSVTVTSNATVSPGPSAGTISKLTVTNALTLQPGGILSMEVDHFGGTNDVIEGMASVTYGGTLSLNVFSVDLSSSLARPGLGVGYQ